MTRITTGAMMLIVLAGAGIAGSASAQGTANAADLVILANRGAAPGVRELAAGFEHVSGHCNISVPGGKSLGG